MLNLSGIAIDPEQHASHSMSDTVSAKAFADIFKHSTPLLDVRSPMEFRRGAFQHASNLPLLDDAEREAVGTRYRQRGKEAAIALGGELVNGDSRLSRLSAGQDLEQCAEPKPHTNTISIIQRAANMLPSYKN